MSYFRMKVLLGIFCFAILLFSTTVLYAEDVKVSYAADNTMTLEVNGFAGISPASTAFKPVYRFFNTGTNGHFFTIKEDEKNTVIANYPQFRYEGVAFYACETADCSGGTSGGGGGGTCTTPQSGTWNGDVASFNISYGGTSLTSAGSSLCYSGTCYMIKLRTGSCNMYINAGSSVPINNCSFSTSGTFSDGSTLSFSGQFVNGNSANGSFTYSGTGSEAACSGSGSWSTNF